MAMKASFFRIGRDRDLAPGSLIQQSNNWLLRTTIHSQGEDRPSALWLTGEHIGTFQLLDDVSRCVTLDPALKRELRLDSPIEGSSGARIGSLVWSENESSHAICAVDRLFMTLEGGDGPLLGHSILLCSGLEHLDRGPRWQGHRQRPSRHGEIVTTCTGRPRGRYYHPLIKEEKWAIRTGYPSRPSRKRTTGSMAGGHHVAGFGVP